MAWSASARAAAAAARRSNTARPKSARGSFGNQGREAPARAKVSGAAAQTMFGITKLKNPHSVAIHRANKHVPKLYSGVSLHSVKRVERVMTKRGFKPRVEHESFTGGVARTVIGFRR